MQLVNNAIKRLEGQTLNGDAIEWQRYLKPSDISRIISASDLAEECKREILLGRERELGLMLPWNGAKDKVLIKPGKVAVWTGWSHHGKTAMLKQVMLSAIQQGEKVLIASMEEEIKEVWRDLAFAFTGGQSPTARALDEFIGFAQDHLWLYDQQGTIEPERMQAVLRYAGAELKTTQAVIDSLMMMSVGKDDFNTQNAFVGELKSIAKDTHQTIHLVAHMRKREGKGGEESPGGMHDIAGGHEIGSKADYVFNVWRDKQRKDEKQPECVLSVEKQRGQTNWIGRIGLNFHPDSRQFIEGWQTMSFGE